MKLLILASLFLSTVAFASKGNIQNENIKSEAELVSAGSDASHLPNDDKVWVKALGINATLNQAITSGLIGTGSLNQNFQTGTAYTLALSDKGKLISFTNSAGVAVTIPPTSSVALPVNTVIEAIANGTGTTQFVAGAGVTIKSRSGFTALSAQYSHAWLMKTATNTWYLYGDIATAFPIVSGCTVTFDGNFNVHTCLGDADIVVTSVPTGATAQLQLVAGGGSGGGDFGAGGAGGVLPVASFPMVVGTTHVTVGIGGVGTTSPLAIGGDTIFGPYTAKGGGGSGTNGPGTNAYPGGSGGGGSNQVGFQAGAAGTPGQGNAGGNGHNTPGPGYQGGGAGGGCSAVGGTSSNGFGVAGGDGCLSSISGTPTYYGGGGSSSGNLQGTPIAGGLGGGGIGAVGGNPSLGGPGVDGFGGGGGGGFNAPAGGKGSFIYRYLAR